MDVTLQIRLLFLGGLMAMGSLALGAGFVLSRLMHQREVWRACAMFSRAVEQLEVTPDVLRALLSPLSAAEADWKPAPQRFSVAEVMAHLCDTETQVFRTRVHRMVEEDGPQLDAYDQEAIAAAGGYAAQSAQETLKNFQQQRTDNLTYLRNLPAEVGNRVGIHPELGQITLAQLLNEWAFHDLGHLRQIAELLRAYRFYPHLGAFQKYYTVNP
jgi:hypothetical protein